MSQEILDVILLPTCVWLIKWVCVCGGENLTILYLQAYNQNLLKDKVGEEWVVLYCLRWKCWLPPSPPTKMISEILFPALNFVSPTFIFIGERVFSH